MRLRLAIPALLFLFASCDVYGVYYSFAHVPGYHDGTGDLPAAYQLGDTVTFEVTEHYAEGSSGSPALAAPELGRRCALEGAVSRAAG